MKQPTEPSTQPRQENEEPIEMELEDFAKLVRSRPDLPPPVPADPEPRFAGQHRKPSPEETKRLLEKLVEIGSR